MTTFKKIHDVACFFQLNTTRKGKLIDQIESIYICLNTFTKLSLSNISNINRDATSSMLPQRTYGPGCFIFPLS